MGGTKTDMTLGTSFADMAEPVRIPTTDPETTLGEIVSFFDGAEVSAVGVASFGPMQLDRASSRFGTMLFTPKPGWSGVAIHERLSSGLGLPVVLDTDVNGAVVGEGEWGAARGMDHHVYVTVGTGIGAGIVVAGRVIGGGRHPEMGHIVVSRHHDDRHEGSCPYHGECLEGMASGPALEARFGRSETWAGNQAVVDHAAHYLAQGLVDPLQQFRAEALRQLRPRQREQLPDALDAHLDQARAVVLDWCYGFYNHDRRHTSAGMMSPINYENTTAPTREAA